MAPFGPLLVPTADFVAPAEPGRTPRRIAFARGEPWGGNFSGGEFRLLLAPAVEIDAQVPQRIGGEKVGQSVAVEIADGHGHRHGGFGHIPALIQDGKKTAETGEETVLVDSGPQVRGLQGSFETPVTDRILRPRRSRRGILRGKGQGQDCAGQGEAFPEGPHGQQASEKRARRRAVCAFGTRIIGRFSCAR